MRYPRFSVLLFVPLLFACSPGGGRVELAVDQRQDNSLTLTVANHTAHALVLPKHLIVSGRGGGDVAAMIVDKEGRLMPTCALIEVLIPERETVEIKSGGAHQGWSGSLKLLKQWHCLESGQYAVAFALLLPTGGVVISEPFGMTVTKSGEVTFSTPSR